MTVVVGDDIVPRLSRQSVEDVLQAAVALGAEKRTITRVLSLVPWSDALYAALRIVAPAPPSADARQQPAGPSQSPDADAPLTDREAFERSIRSTLAANMHSEDRADPPGVCFWAPPRAAGAQRDHRIAQRARVNLDALVEVSPTAFEELTLTPSCIMDHQPLAYDSALLVDEVGHL